MICLLSLQDTEVALGELSRQHKWFVSNHASRTLCNVCGEALHGVAWNGLSCEGQLCSVSHSVWCAHGCTQCNMLLDCHICTWITNNAGQLKTATLRESCGFVLVQCGIL